MDPIDAFKIILDQFDVKYGEHCHGIFSQVLRRLHFLNVFAKRKNIEKEVEIK